jgi:hypothetical protein
MKKYLPHWIYLGMWILVIVASVTIVNQSREIIRHQQPPWLTYLSPVLADTKATQVLAEAKTLAHIGAPQIGFSYTPGKHLDHKRELSWLKVAVYKTPTVYDHVPYPDYEYAATMRSIEKIEKEIDQIFKEGVTHEYALPHVRSWLQDYRLLERSDQAIQRNKNWKPETVVWDFPFLIMQMLYLYVGTCLLAFCLFYAVAESKGMAFSQLLTRPDLICGWPVMFWVAMKQSPLQLVRAGLRLATAFLTLGLSLAPGAALAQSGKKDAKKGSESAWVLPESEAAQAPVNDQPKVRFSGKTIVLSKYVAKIGLVPNEHAVVQTDVTAAFKNGMYFNLWTAARPDGKADFGDEVDLTVGWSGKGLDFGVTYVDLTPKLGLGGDGDILQSYAVWSHPFKVARQDLIGYVEMDHLLATSNTKQNSSVMVMGGVRTTKKIGKAQVNLDLSAMAESGLFNTKPALLGRFNTSLVLPLTKHLSIIPVRVYSVLANPASGRGTQTAFGVGLAFAQ